MSSRKDDVQEEIPEKLYDSSTATTYKRLRFFGKVSSTINLSQSNIVLLKILNLQILTLDRPLFLPLIIFDDQLGRLCKML